MLKKGKENKERVTKSKSKEAKVKETAKKKDKAFKATGKKKIMLVMFHMFYLELVHLLFL